MQKLSPERQPIVGGSGIGYFAAFLISVLCIWQLLVGIKWGIGGWSSIHMAEALSWLHGYPLYGNLKEGPIMDGIYGPFAFLPYTIPGSVSKNPVVCIALAVLENWLLTVAGIVSIARALGCTWRQAFWFCSSLLLMMDIFSPTNIAVQIWADAPALFFISMAIAWSLNYRKSVAPAATALAMAVFTRQQCIFALPAFAAFYFWYGGWPQAGRFLLVWLSVVVCLAVVFGVWFGASAIWESMFVMPARQPWVHSVFPETVTETIARSSWSERFRTLAVIAWLQMRHLSVVLLFGASMSLLLLAIAKRFLVEATLNLSRFTLCWGIAACMLPAACLGRAKIGGNVNHLAFDDFFWILGVWVLLFFSFRDFIAANLIGENWRRRLAMGHLLAVGGVGFLLSLSLISGTLAKNPEIEQELTAFTYCKEKPGQCYFPWNPLAVLKAEGRIYSFEVGVWDFNRARLFIGRDLLLKTLPNYGQMMAVPGFRESYLATAYGEWNELHYEVPGLKGWRVFSRKIGNSEGMRGDPVGTQLERQ